VIGFGSSSTHANRNQYRIMGRRSSATAWPSDTAAPSTSTTLDVRPWVDLTTLQQGVVMAPGGTGTNDRFEIAFDLRGAMSVSTGDFAPFQLQKGSRLKAIRVSAVGGVSVE
jgi:hypothetical protein